MSTFVIALIASCPALLATLALMIVAVRTHRKVELVEATVGVVAVTVEAVHHEVKTMNAQSLAEIADADETRRIEAIPTEDRSKIERSHMRSVEQDREE